MPFHWLSGYCADHQVAHVVPGVELGAQRLAAVAVDEGRVPGRLQLRAGREELVPVGREREPPALLKAALL